MLTRTIRFAVTSAFVLGLGLASPRAASADVLLTPFLGVTFGGDTASQQVNYGFSLAFLGGGVFGVEADVALTPDFFGSNAGALEDSNVSTVMGNLILSAPLSNPGIRPYASGGVGLIRAKATSVGNVFDLDENSFGVNIGAGVIGQVSDHVGIRGDIRYFRGLQDSDAGAGIDLDLNGFNFWRGTLGVAFRF